jgi:hypothetical protein
MKIYINNNTSFLILKKYLDIGYNNNIYNRNDLKLINAALKYIAVEFKLDLEKPKPKQLKTIKELPNENISTDSDD